MRFTEAVIICLKKYATFRGRATRAEYWWFALFNMLLYAVVHAIVQFWQGQEAATIASALVQLVLFLPSLAAGVRRLHDINFSGWWMLLMLTIVGSIPLLIFYCLPGKEAENRFGSRMEATPATRTRLISTREELATLTETRVFRTEQQADGSWCIVLAFRNTQEFQVRLTNLTDTHQVLLLDQDDFAHEQLPGGESVVTVPERAAQKVTFLFPDLDGSTPKTIRLYGMDIAVPQGAGVRTDEISL